MRITPRAMPLNCARAAPNTKSSRLVLNEKLRATSGASCSRPRAFCGDRFQRRGQPLVVPYPDARERRYEGAQHRKPGAPEGRAICGGRIRTLRSEAGGHVRLLSASEVRCEADRGGSIEPGAG